MFSAKSTLTRRNDTYPFISPSRFKSALRGKVVIVTGAGRGIGRVSALAFAAAGASVACIARRRDDIDAVVSEIEQKYGTPAIAVNADVADPAAPKRIVKEAELNLGPVDILLNIAGVTRFGTLEAEEDFNDWWRVLEINLRGPVSLIHAVLPSMIARKTGIVISVASTSGSQDIPFNTAYATSKAALIKFHQDLAVELEGKGIFGFSVHPGTVATDLGTSSGAFNTKSLEKEPRMQEMLSTFKGMQMQTPELAADTFVTLCADWRLKAFNGKYIDAEQDLGEVLDDALKGGQSRIKKERLYHLKLEEL